MEIGAAQTNEKSSRTDKWKKWRNRQTYDFIWNFSLLILSGVRTFLSICYGTLGSNIFPRYIVGFFQMAAVKQLTVLF